MITVEFVRNTLTKVTVTVLLATAVISANIACVAVIVVAMVTVPLVWVIQYVNVTSVFGAINASLIRVKNIAKMVEYAKKRVDKRNAIVQRISLVKDAWIWYAAMEIVIRNRIHVIHLHVKMEAFVMRFEM